MVHLGDPKEVADRYLEINFGRDPDALGAADGRGGDGDARVLDVWVSDAEGKRLPAVPQGHQALLNALVDFRVAVEDPLVSIDVHDEDHNTVFVASTLPQLEHSGRFSAGEQVQFSFAFDNVLALGRYSPVVNLAHRGSGLDVIDRYERGFSFLVTGSTERRGSVELPIEVSIERVAAPVSERVGA
jgi:hypothetical protein